MSYERRACREQCRLQVTSGRQERRMKHRCPIMLQTKSKQTELALRIYFKTLMALPCVRGAGVRKTSTHMTTQKKTK